MHGVLAGGYSACASSAAPAGVYSVWQPTQAPCQQRRQFSRTPLLAAVPAGAAVAAAAARGQGCQRTQRLATLKAAPARAVLAAAAAQDQAQDEEWVEVGRIGPPHGVRGEMKVQPLTDFPEDRLATPGTRWLQAPAPKIGRRAAPPPEEVELEWGRAMISRGNEVWLVKLEGVESPEEAAELRGHTLLIPASAREPLADEDEFYVQDLVGLKVVLQATGEEVGTVSDVFDGTGTHDVLRIQLAQSKLDQLAAAAAAASGSGSDDGEEEEEEEEAAAGSSSGGSKHVLLPFAKAMVPVVDLKARVMQIAPPAGLLELAAPSNMRKARKENRGKRDRRRTRPRGRNAAQAGEQAAAAAP